ncbi:hypothetical protein HU200_030291 [Digitaria exilis]|uniref:Uncharacterized protein n=1 Tax=Digitaria exilis TaxID=1010633 RepID=A0A835EU56_9POAL|nr:hypothetical protein HU200_030291 [Digitaria exilis]
MRLPRWPSFDISEDQAQGRKVPCNTERMEYRKTRPGACGKELGIYLLCFDRAGYGESDPNPDRDVKSEALDIEELADQLELGQKVLCLGGPQWEDISVWGCLQYIPHRQI